MPQRRRRRVPLADCTNNSAISPQIKVDEKKMTPIKKDKLKTAIVRREKNLKSHFKVNSNGTSKLPKKTTSGEKNSLIMDELKAEAIKRANYLKVHIEVNSNINYGLPKTTTPENKSCLLKSKLKEMAVEQAKRLQVRVEINSELERNVSVPRREASRKAATKIANVVRTQINTNLDITCINNKKTNKIEDVYKFTYDPKDESIRKTKKGKLLEIIDESSDENNSMKEFVHKLRLKELKKAKKILYENKKHDKLLNQHVTVNKESVRIINVCEKSVDHDNIVNNHENETKINRTSEGAIDKVLNRLGTTGDESINNNNETEANSIIDAAEALDNEMCDDLTCADDDSDSVRDIYQAQNADSGKSLQEIICDSFLEDLDQYNDTSFSSVKMLPEKALYAQNSPVRSPKLNISANVLVCPTNNDMNTTKQSTPPRTSLNLELSNPWRLNFLHRGNPHTFQVKRTSFTPSYNQDMIISSTATRKVDSCAKWNKTEKSMSQPSMLNFVSGFRNSKDIPIKQGGLFESPRKVLCELNFQQSTPFHAPVQSNAFSPNLSAIKPNRNDANNLSSLFGFSCDEDTENVNPNIGAAVASSRSPKKNKKKMQAVLFSDVVHVQQADAPDRSSEPANVQKGESPSVDVNLLFQDVENDNKELRVKKTRRSYEHIRAKRKRLPSWHPDTSDSETEEQEARQVVKIHTKRSKKEELETERLAQYYNSMFEEIEHYPLCIE